MKTFIVTLRCYPNFARDNGVPLPSYQAMDLGYFREYLVGIYSQTDLLSLRGKIYGSASRAASFNMMHIEECAPDLRDILTESSKTYAWLSAMKEDEINGADIVLR